MMVLNGLGSLLIALPGAAGALRAVRRRVRHHGVHPYMATPSLVCKLVFAYLGTVPRALALVIPYRGHA